MDNQSPNCPVCNSEMRLIPAGISKKSGKPYDAFYGCKTYGCKGSIKIAPDGTPSPKSYATAQKSIANQTSDNINRFESKKEESMKTMASGRDAVLVVTSMYKENAWTDEQIQEKIKEWAKWMKENIYNPPFIG